MSWNPSSGFGGHGAHALAHPHHPHQQSPAAFGHPSLAFGASGGSANTTGSGSAFAPSSSSNGGAGGVFTPRPSSATFRPSQPSPGPSGAASYLQQQHNHAASGHVAGNSTNNNNNNNSSSQTQQQQQQLRTASPATTAGGSSHHQNGTNGNMMGMQFAGSAGSVGGVPNGHHFGSGGHAHSHSQTYGGAGGAGGAGGFGHHQNHAALGHAPGNPGGESALSQLFHGGGQGNVGQQGAGGAGQAANGGGSSFGNGFMSGLGGGLGSNTGVAGAMLNGPSGGGLPGHFSSLSLGGGAGGLSGSGAPSSSPNAQGLLSRLAIGGAGGGGQNGNGMGGFGAGSAGQQQQGGGQQQGSQSGLPAGLESSMLWQQQVLKAEACRQSASPHHRARASALASRMVHQKTSIPILDPNKPVSHISAAAVANGHKKAGSLATTTGGDDAASEASPVPAHPTATSAPAKQDEPSEPWTGIDLGGIRLRTLAPSLFAFTHITALYVNHNQLTTLSPAIAQLRCLTHLDATGNQLVTVPPELGLVSTLKELLLFDNAITNLPLELGTLHQLEFLGIEGNPINDTIRHLIAEKGTQGLIAHFRDHCPIPPPPPPRKWEVVEDTEGGADGPGSSGAIAGGISASHSGGPGGGSSSSADEQFSVMCWNILYERYATAQMYGYTPSWALEWTYRRDLIWQEITQALTDVVCLQECGDHEFHDFFQPRLSELGYDGIFNSKTRARTMSSDERKRVDGCATFWKRSKYDLILHDVFEFNQIALNKTDMRTDDMFNRVMSRDDISNICLLENKDTLTRLVVVNAHIYWNHTYRDVKLVQAAIMVEQTILQAQNFARLPPKRQVPCSRDDPEATSRQVPVYPDVTDMPIIICGDFNSLPDSTVYDFFTQGVVAADHEDFMEHQYGEYTARGLSHRLHLRSAYSPIGELHTTNHTPGFRGAIDYIWYSHSSLAVTSVLGDLDKGYLARTVGFPNAHHPSDHIPISATFRVKTNHTKPVRTETPQPQQQQTAEYR